jgi:hypothetical protein
MEGEKSHLHTAQRKRSACNGQQKVLQTKGTDDQILLTEGTQRTAMIVLHDSKAHAELLLRKSVSSKFSCPQTTVLSQTYCAFLDEEYPI